MAFEGRSIVPPSNIEFAKEEERILELWKKLNAFETCLKQSAGKPRFTFYDGPPFATGLPHFGHILAGTIKDIVPRWMHQHGYHVSRRFGWDTHGLPVENEIDKTFKIKGPADVAKMGIDAYNNECRKIVMRYSSEWEKTVSRLGRWIDFKNDYKTLYPWYMETIWWVFKQLWDKGLIYKGFRVMPYSTGCCTPLANFEASQNYMDVNDPAVVVTFPLDEDYNVNLVAWTTTPWTLPSNLALCVHPNLDYVKVQEVSSGKIYVLMEARLSSMYKKEEEYVVLDKFKGDTLKNKKYKPIFPYFEHFKKPGSAEGAFRVLCDNYVTESSGTGIVHQAPYFGEDDNRVCLREGIVHRGDQEIVLPLDEVGKFVDPVTDFRGHYVKDADKSIIKKLRDDGRLVSSSQINHSYPFCWRTDTPLLYRAVPSWFMRVEQMKDKLLDRNSDTYWVPDTIKEGRFGNWLRDARDWNLSRNRYWGTPIPVWQSEDGEESVCVGSIDELEKLTGVRVKDLHRETVDKLTIPSAKPGNPPLRRIAEVFDCWFESGSMPYAQLHYPFENKKEFDESFPADFIAEGADQTRGWFYTLLVLSTALFNKPPFKNLIVNGLVLAADGQKMSKRKKNYPDPMVLMSKYGADALRLFLINSPVVKAESLRFKEEGVRDILKDVFLPWYNAFRFLMQNIDAYQTRESGEAYLWSEEECLGKSDNVMDRWIVSFTQSLLVYVKKEMAAYRLYTVLPRLMKFIDNLTNWYVRMNRKRLRGEGNSGRDCKAALDSLFSVLFTMVRVFAPFTPFLTESLYQRLKPLIKGYADDKDKASVHYLMIPSPRDDLINQDIERAVARMQTVIDIGRVIRDRKTMPVKYPLPELVLIHKDQQCLDAVATLQEYVLDELNVKRLTLSSDKKAYGVVLKAEPNFKALGARLKDALKTVMAEVKKLDDSKLERFLKDGKIEVSGHTLGEEDLRVMYAFAKKSEKYETDSDNDVLVLLDCTPDQAMLDEGVSREVVNRIQKLRKKASLVQSDAVTAYYEVDPPAHDLSRIIEEYSDSIESTTKSPVRGMASKPSAREVIVEDKYELKGAKLNIVLVRGFPSNYAKPGPVVELEVNNGTPVTKFVNLVFENRLGVVLLENPIGQNAIKTCAELATAASDLFDQEGLVLSDCNGARLSNASSTSAIAGDIVYARKADGEGCGTAKISGAKGSFCKFVTVESGDAKGTLLLENPRANDLGKYLCQVTRVTFGSKDGQLYKDAAKNVAADIFKTGSTLYA